jgi:hypothetical protein
MEYERLKVVRSTATYVPTGRGPDPLATVFNALRIDAKEARIDCDVSRLTLERHRRVHSGAN